MTPAIIICATKSFQHCLMPQARAVQQNASVAGIAKGHVILATCECNERIYQVKKRYGALLPGWEFHHLPLPVKEGASKDYSVNALLLISQLYSAAFDKARSIGVSHAWTLESDVIPGPTNLRCMRDMLTFDGGYYDVAFCPYISAGGGGIMGGRGSVRHWIMPNWTEEEIKIPDELAKEIAEHKARMGEKPTEEWQREMQRLADEAKKHPPKGNVFQLNAEHGWKPRGWLEWAYPALGRGAVVPSDWLPMGNNLFSERALNLADFHGYAGRGTQDLFLSHERLGANDLRFCVIPHSTSGHVVRKPNPEGAPYTLYSLYHEPEGECVGHLRTKELPFYTCEPGETFTPKDDYSI